MCTKNVYGAGSFVFAKRFFVCWWFWIFKKSCEVVDGMGGVSFLASEVFKKVDGKN